MQNEPILEIDEYENKHWYLNGVRHRTDGPAIEFASGDKYWFMDGELHRTNGPAIDCSDGDKYWFLNGKCHRVDGPAIEYADGNKEWYLHNNKYSLEEWLELTPLSEKEKVKLRLQYAK